LSEVWKEFSQTTGNGALGATVLVGDRGYILVGVCSEVSSRSDPAAPSWVEEVVSDLDRGEVSSLPRHGFTRRKRWYEVLDWDTHSYRLVPRARRRLSSDIVHDLFYSASLDAYIHRACTEEGSCVYAVYVWEGVLAGREPKPPKESLFRRILRALGLVR